MLRGVVAFLILAVVAATLSHSWWVKDREFHQQQAGEIAELNQQLKKLEVDNKQLQQNLAKVQEEQNRLAASNEALRKAIEQAKVTGKMPGSLPYPPK